MENGNSNGIERKSVLCAIPEMEMFMKDRKDQHR